MSFLCLFSSTLGRRKQQVKPEVSHLWKITSWRKSMSMHLACQVVAPKLGVSWHTAWQWAQEAHRAGNFPGLGPKPPL